MGLNDIRAGGAYVEIGGEMDGLKSQLASAQKGLQALGRRVMKVGATFTALGTAATGSLFKLTQSLTAANDKIVKTAGRLGMSADSLAELGYAARLSGIRVETLQTALQRMVRRVSEAGHGTGEAKKAIAELGFDAQRLARLSPDEQFLRIAGAMENVGGQGERVRLAMRLFDSEGVALVQMLGRDIGALAEQFRFLSGSIDYDAAEEFQNATTRLLTALKGVGNAIVNTTAPAFSSLMDRMSALAVGFRRLIENNPQIVSGLLTTAKAMVAVGVAATGLGAAVIALSSPLIVTVLATSVAVLSLLETFNVVELGVNKSLENMTEGFSVFGLTIADHVKNLGKAIRTGFFAMLEGVTEALNKAVNFLADKLGWLVKQFAKHSADMQLISEETAESLTKGYEKGAAKVVDVTDVSGFYAKLAAESEVDRLEFKVEAKEEAKDLPTLSNMVDKIRTVFSTKLPDLLGSTEPPALDVPDGGIGDQPTSRSFGFFGGARIGEMLGGSTTEQKQLQESQKHTALLEQLVNQEKTARLA